MTEIRLIHADELMSRNHRVVAIAGGALIEVLVKKVLAANMVEDEANRRVIFGDHRSRLR